MARLSAHGATVLVGTPGRLADVVARTRGDTAALDLRRLEVSTLSGSGCLCPDTELAPDIPLPQLLAPSGSPRPPLRAVRFSPTVPTAYKASDALRRKKELLAKELAES